MIEMLIVVAVIAVLLTIAMPRVDYVSMRLDGNVRTVRSTIQQAWRLSIQKQHDVLVSFDTVARRMRILEDANNDGVASTGERVTWRPLEEGVLFELPPTGVNGAVGGAVAGSGVKTVGGLPTVFFRRNGSTSGDAEVYLAAVDRGVRKRRAITVAHATGRTEWFRFVNNTWRSGGI